MCSNVDWGIAFCGIIVIRDSCIVIDALDIDAVIAALTDCIIVDAATDRCFFFQKDTVGSTSIDRVSLNVLTDAAGSIYCDRTFANGREHIFTDQLCNLGMIGNRYGIQGYIRDRVVFYGTCNFGGLINQNSHSGGDIRF